MGHKLHGNHLCVLFHHTEAVHLYNMYNWFQIHITVTQQWGHFDLGLILFKFIDYFFQPTCKFTSQLLAVFSSVVLFEKYRQTLKEGVFSPLIKEKWALRQKSIQNIKDGNDCCSPAELNVGWKGCVYWIPRRKEVLCVIGPAALLISQSDSLLWCSIIPHTLAAELGVLM